ncbi:RNA-directed DNA polymerase from mobile element jockey-like protein [Willisornis vidua]|uniref:RNA-directed DNA polymerase from mobile element jockey-like protein n=1 Tax=Willisornis vidua TaxID=1566151 RepID=A0ABQ9DV25_9PASS|nr:RNA-directed DNA polymerase from mobile element jockey-like protein [Willisornis vidua]
MTENDQLPIGPGIVCDRLLQLHSYKSIGTDGIHQRILKELDDVIAKPLLMIFEWSWEFGEVPSDWKLANVVLIFKKVKNEDPGNYRPVSLISMSVTVMEKIILEGMAKHLKDKAIIGPSQHSFMRGNSCLSNLISFKHKDWKGYKASFQMTKLSGSVDSLKGREALQRDLSKLEDRAITGHRKYSKGKCRILYRMGQP